LVARRTLLVGIGLIGVLTATAASVFIKEHTDANKAEFKKGHADLGQQLAVISERLAAVEGLLGAPESGAAEEGSTEPTNEGPTPSGVTTWHRRGESRRT